ncbi:MAG: hypothetical protein ACYC2O_11985 [Microthrixaceae bacterium]
MNTRRAVTAALLASLALFAGACGGSDDEGKDKETTTTAGDAEQPTTTLADDDYLAQLEVVNTAIVDAGTDVCALTEATAQMPYEPSSSAQVEATVATAVQLYNAIAGAFPADAAASADAWRSAATSLQTAAEEADYAKDFFNSEAATSALSGETYETAVGEYQALFEANCVSETSTAPGDGATAETVPEG